MAALGSFLDARAHHGEWRVRMEDLDPPRESPGAAADILRTLEQLGLHWDGPVLYQSARVEAYRAAVEVLRTEGWAYPCACSRREIADSGLRGVEGAVYPGTCRNGIPPGKQARAIRLRVNAETLSFQDQLQGTVSQNLAEETGDFVLRRADGFHAYQLAVVLDDAHQGITHVVRGADLLLSTPRQLYLQRRLGLPTPFYMHLPVAVNAAGEKLSKQTGAPAVNVNPPVEALFQALVFLDQSPPRELRRTKPFELLSWATAHWQPQVLEGLRSRGFDTESTL